MEHLTKTSYN